MRLKSVVMGEWRTQGLLYCLPYHKLIKICVTGDQNKIWRTIKQTQVDRKKRQLHCTDIDQTDFKNLFSPWGLRTEWILLFILLFGALLHCIIWLCWKILNPQGWWEHLFLRFVCFPDIDSTDFLTQVKLHWTGKRATLWCREECPWDKKRLIHPGPTKKTQELNIY